MAEVQVVEPLNCGSKFVHSSYCARQDEPRMQLYKMFTAWIRLLLVGSRIPIYFVLVLLQINQSGLRLKFVSFLQNSRKKFGDSLIYDTIASGTKTHKTLYNHKTLRKDRLFDRCLAVPTLRLSCPNVWLKISARRFKAIMFLQDGMWANWWSLADPGDGWKRVKDEGG